VLQEAVDECFSGERAQPGLSGIGGPVAKGHRRNKFRVVFELDQAAVGDGHSEDIGSQVFQSGTPIAYRFAVHHPILLPEGGGYSRKQIRFDQGLAELAAEDFRERPDRQQEILAGRQPGMGSRRQAASRDQLMDVRVVSQVAPPGVQDTHQSNLAAHKTRALCQVLGSAS